MQNYYKFGYVDMENGVSRVFNCYARDLNEAFYFFGTEMERRHGYNAPEKLALIEVRENGVEVDW